ncbi:MAG: two-component regulator propeller domain-containing protein [Chitinophagaceae bacterium]
MPTCRVLFFFSIVFVIGTGSIAQVGPDYSFRHINQEDGLRHNNVLSITQDTKGFIWLVTKNGLQRYDGSRFLNFAEMLTDPAEPRASGAIAYADSSRNSVWIMKMNKIERYNLSTNRFTQYDLMALHRYPEFLHEKYTDDKNNPWLIGENTVFVYDSSKQQYNLIASNINPFQAHASNYLVHENGGAYALMPGNPDGLYVFDKATKKVYTGSFNPLHFPILDAFRKVLTPNGYPIRHLMKDSRNNYWLTLWRDLLFRYNPVTGKIVTYSLPGIIKKRDGVNTNIGDKIINGLYQDNHGAIWLFTENAGLLKYNEAKDDFDPIFIDELNSLANRFSYAVNCVFQDREENLWLGTDRGITIFNPYRKYYRTIHHEENNPASLPKSEITSFIQTSTGHILAGTWGGGITVFDSNFQFKKNNYLAGPSDHNLIWSFIQNEDGSVWAGCQHGAINICTSSGDPVTTINPPETAGSTVRCMTRDAAGNTWLGLQNGELVKWDRLGQRFVKAAVPAGIPKLPPVLFIFFDRTGACWVSTESGLKKFDADKLAFTDSYLPDKNNPQSISGKTTTSIEQYNDSVLLIGTIYGGLNFFNINTKAFSHIGLAEGLPSNTVYAIKKDSAENIWFTTEYSLYKFHPPDKKFIRFNTALNDIASSFNALQFRQLTGGRWLTATETELLCFTPGKPAFTSSDPRVEIAGFRVFDKPMFIDSLLALQRPVELDYRNNFLTVEFALLNFSSIQQTRYAYRMSGVNSDWVNADTKQFASYTNLSPGQYIFSVKADNDSNQSAETSFTIIITPPFWKTKWFLLLVIACIILLVYLFVRWRITSIRAVEAEKLKVQKLNAEQYRNNLEMEQIVNYFSSSLINKSTVDDVLWDVAKNLIGRLGFEDGMIYLWNKDKTRMVQRAGYGPKGSIEEIQKKPFDVSAGQGVVGYVIGTREPVIIADTSADPRYRADEMTRLSEITVPIIYNDELIGVIDSEHHKKRFFTEQHIQVLSTIATLMANKIKSIESEQSLQQAKIEMLGISEKLSAAKLEALRSQMNPHFIFNCINSIDNLIQNDDKESATLYLAKFAKLIRSILETSKANTVPCWKDMETLRVYIELETLRLDNKFSCEVNIAPEILNGDYKVPPLVIQPFVENAIHHGLLNKIDTDRKLLINVWAGDNYIYYLVEDNGVGRAKAAAYKELNKAGHESMGMQISIDRINLFNLQNNGAVIITDLFNDQHEAVGTRVEVKLINQ